MNTSSHLLLQISRWVSSCWQGSFLGLICISLLLWCSTASSPSSCIGRILSPPCSAKACICCAACCHSRIFIHVAVIMMRSKHAARSTHARLGYNSMPKDILSCSTDFTMRYRGVLRVSLAWIETFLFVIFNQSWTLFDEEVRNCGHWALKFFVSASQALLYVSLFS